MCMIPVTVTEVCACDGLTYDTECFANMAGANVGTGADCGSADACSVDADCTSEEYCNKDTCDAVTGTCALKSTICPLIINPVCGCDGTTYNNSCLASANGVNVDDTGTACGTNTACVNDSDCTSGFCYKTTCDAMAEGVCEDIPTICLILGDDVCGCDGTTYGTECLAMKAHVSTDATGVACDTDTTCSTNDDCATTEYCAKTGCDELTGTCTTIPTTCKPLESEVCGCDGAVYPNSCYAHRGRTNYEAIANCTTTTECTTNLDAKPTTCESATLSVCGCNDTTYKNFCEAAKAGVSVSAIGRCSIF